MCRAIHCSRCDRPSWAGCGAHIEQVLGHVPKEARCRCAAQGPEPSRGPRSPAPSLVDSIRRLLGLTAVLGGLSLAHAASAEVPTPPTREGRHALEASYLGYNFTWPGGQIGYSYRALQSRQRRHALVIGVDLGGYHWPRHSDAVFLLSRIGWRGRHRVGLQGEVGFSLGYQHVMTADESFTVTDGEVRPGGRPGYPMLLFGPTIGVGWFIARWGVTPFVRTGALFEYPNFDQVLTRFQISAGAEVRL